MTQDTLQLGKDVLTGYIQPTVNSNFSFLDKIGIQFTKTNIETGLQIQNYNQIGFTVNKIENKTIFARNSIERYKGRGSQVQITGDSGFRFDVEFTLAGRFFSLRNKVIQLLTSGEPIWFYAPHYQKLNSSRSISTINNQEQLTRDRFYVKVSKNPTISEDDRNIAICVIKVEFQEIPYKKPQTTATFTEIISKVDKIGEMLDGIDAEIGSATLALNSLNNLIFDTANKISSFGQDATQLLKDIKNLKDNTAILLKSPITLVKNLTSILKSTAILFKTLLNQNSNTNTSKKRSLALSSIKSFTNFEVPKPSVVNRYNTKKYINLHAIKSKIVIGKVVFLARIFGIINLIYILRDLELSDKNEVLSILTMLDEAYNKLMFDDSYNGLSPFDSKVEVYTSYPRNDEIASEINPFYLEAKNYLKNLEISLTNNKEFVINQTSNVFDLIHRYYNSEITEENFDDILNKFLDANKIQDTSKLFYPGQSIIYPIFY